MSIRVMLVDDNEHTRTGYSMMLMVEPDIILVGEAADGQEAVDIVSDVAPDVILMDVRMPRLDGIDSTRQITTKCPDVRVLILTTYDLDDYAFDGLAAGASGFLLKDATSEQIAAAIRAIHNGDAVVTPRITRRMLDASRWSPAAPALSADFASLTPREFEVACAIVDGLTNDEIVERFFLTNSTVKAHINRILRKMNARDRVEVVVRGYRAGLAAT